MQSTGAGSVILDLLPDPHQVPAQDRFDVSFGILEPQKLLDQRRKVGNVFHADRQAVADAIEIGTQADVLYADEFNDVLEIDLENDLSQLARKKIIPFSKKISITVRHVILP